MYDVEQIGKIIADIVMVNNFRIRVTPFVIKSLAFLMLLMQHFAEAKLCSPLLIQENE